MSAPKARPDRKGLEGINAGEQGRLIAVGTGATGAIDTLQQIIGIQIQPARTTRRDFQRLTRA